MIFVWNFQFPYSSQKFGLFTKYHYFFPKMSVLLYHPYLHHVFTILPLPSIHQPTMNNQFEALKAPKFRFLLFISHYLCTQTTFLSLFSLYSSKENQDFGSKLCKVQTHDSWSLTTGSVSW